MYIIEGWLVMKGKAQIIIIIERWEGFPQNLKSSKSCSKIFLLALVLYYKSQ